AVRAELVTSRDVASSSMAAQRRSRQTTVEPGMASDSERLRTARYGSLEPRSTAETHGRLSIRVARKIIDESPSESALNCWHPRSVAIPRGDNLVNSSTRLSPEIARLRHRVELHH